MKLAYHAALRRHEWRAIVRALVPAGVWRARAYLRYRRWFPDALVTGDAQVARNARLGRDVIVRGAVVGANAAIGDFTTVGAGTTISGAGAIRIGRYCSLGPGCFIHSENHNGAYVATYPLEHVRDGTNARWDEYPARAITIGHDVWIGRGATVLAGAEIGDGTIVGAGAVVPGKRFPPYAVLAGVPARVVRYRFDDARIAALRAQPWWEAPPERVFGELMGRLHDGDETG